MRKHLPPLTALRAFEASARHMSLKKAAEELNVTPAAISHQIQQLEEALDAPLFRRSHRNVALTEIGMILLPKLQEGFDCLHQAVEQVRERRGADVLSISTAPAFASQWLMPRLHHFVMAHPEIDVQVSTRIRQFARSPRGQRGDVESVMRWADECDAVIVFGNGDYPGMEVDRVLPLSITPLCSPSLVEGEHPLATPEDLKHHVLLHDERGMLYEGKSFWDTWLDASGTRGIDTARGPHFSHSVLALEAAMAGRGVVASTPELAASALRMGNLVAPFPLAVPLASGYYFVSHPPASKREVVKMFRAWLRESIAGGEGDFSARGA
jgi:LysR family glycine cleavage system transcriptional activator